jgi:hypothetical protein
MIRRMNAFLICLVAILLPWRLRIAFANAIGWVGQGVYWFYMRLMRWMLRQLKPGKGGGPA